MQLGELAQFLGGAPAAGRVADVRAEGVPVRRVRRYPHPGAVTCAIT
jgi:hypothetical protein